MSKSKWIYQYLKDESLYYLTEHHPQEGVVSEFYFNTFPELEMYVISNNLPISIHKNTGIQETGSDLSEFKLATLDITLFNKGDYKRYKSTNKITLELIEHVESKELGDYLKKLVQDLKNKIKEEKR